MASADFFTRLQALITQVPGWAAEAMAYTTLEMEQRAKRDAPFTDRTGNLRNSIQGGVVSVDERRVVGAVSAGYPGFGASQEYAIFVELGTSRSRPFPFILPALLGVQADRVFERAFSSFWRHGVGGLP